MPPIVLLVNGARRRVDVPLDMPLLWALRDLLGLTGAKYGCGAGHCGACTVHLGGASVRSCQLPVRAAAGKPITTIEGLSPDGSHPVHGLSAALYGGVTVEAGRVRETNFDRYRLTRMREAPRVETWFVSSEAPPSGLGEPPATAPDHSPSLIRSTRRFLAPVL